MKKNNQSGAFERENFWRQKKMVYLAFLSLLSAGVAGTLYFFKARFQDDITHLAQQKESAHLQISEALKNQKKWSKAERLIKAVQEEGYDKPGLRPREINKLIKKISRTHYLEEIHLKPGKAQHRDYDQHQDYTLFFTAALDTDVYKFIKAFSREVKGVLTLSLVSLFREEDGALKGEIRFSLVNSAQGGDKSLS